MYDIVAAGKLLKHSYMMNKEQTLELFPMLKAERLKGSIVYYDGQQNDARMALTVACTAARLGATVLNHCEVLELHHESVPPPADVGTATKKPPTRRVSGAKVRDAISGKGSLGY